MGTELRLPCDVGEVSDGFHTFNELYEHRQTLFVALANRVPTKAWKSRLHADGTMFEGPEGWFIAGLHLPDGDITYHLEGRFWDLLRVEEMERAPEWDGHTPADVVKRIKEWA